MIGGGFRTGARDVVDGAGHVGQEVGVAVGVAGHQGADLGPLGGLGHRTEQRPALQVRAVAVAGEGEEVIPGEDRVRTHLLGPPPGVAHRRIGAVLGLHLHPDPDPSRFGHGGEP
jgi:hypothetical protein